MQSTKPKEDLRYYDELIEKMKDMENDENPESKEEIDIIYGNIIDQLKESDDEAKKCFTCSHIDYFVYKSKTSHFVELFDLVTKEDCLAEYVFDVKISRALEAVLTCLPHKLDSESHFEQYRKCLKRLGNYFTENFQGVIDNEIAIFTLRSFLRILRSNEAQEKSEISTSNLKKPQKKQDKSKQFYFNLKGLETKFIPDDWKIQKFLKKFNELVVKIPNLLDMALIKCVSPFLSLLMHKLSFKYEGECVKLVELVDKQLKKKQSAFHSMIQDPIGSRFIETFLCLASSEICQHYFDKFIFENSVAYCKHIYANPVIQSLLKNMNNDGEQLKSLFNATVGVLGQVIDFNSNQTFKHFLVLELIDTCGRNNFESEDLMKVFF